VARRLGIPVAPSAVQSLVIPIDALFIPGVLPFGVPRSATNGVTTWLATEASGLESFTRRKQSLPEHARPLLGRIDESNRRGGWRAQLP
jgi:hypothetical protein